MLSRFFNCVKDMEGEMCIYKSFREWMDRYVHGCIVFCIPQVASLVQIQLGIFFFSSVQFCGKGNFPSLLSAPYPSIHPSIYLSILYRIESSSLPLETFRTFFSLPLSLLSREDAIPSHPAPPIPSPNIPRERRRKKRCPCPSYASPD